MHYIELTEFGDPATACRCVDGPAPGAPGQGEVLVAVEAGPINPAELLLIQGKYAAQPALPIRLGIEGVGTVCAVGQGVTSVSVGDRVMSLERSNWAEQLLLAEAAVLRVPAGLDVAQAAMLKVNPATAALLLDRYVSLAPGNWVIQNAANSAVGQYLIQLARARGLHTANVVRRDGLADPLRDIGADLVFIDGPDLAARVRAEIGDAHMPLAVDAVAGTGTLHLAGALSDGGTVVNYGLLSGQPCQIGADQTVFKGITLTGFWLAKLLGAMARAELEQLYADLAARVADGTIHAPVEASYGLQDIAAALAHAQRGGRFGKILITPNGPIGGIA